MLKKIFGSALFGVEAFTIAIEVNVDKGIGYHLVGLPDNAIKESNFRIAAALQNNGYKIPGKKLIINMSPADMRKEGAAYDLPLAMGILPRASHSHVHIRHCHHHSYSRLAQSPCRVVLRRCLSPPNLYPLENHVCLCWYVHMCSDHVGCGIE